MAIASFSWRSLAVGGLIAGWWVGLSGAIVGLMVAHLRPIPLPAVAAASVTDGATPPARLTTPTNSPSWTLTHVLIAACPCSDAVAEHLASEPPIDGIRQQVLVLGDAADSPWPTRLAARGMRVLTGTAAEAHAAAIQVRGGPVLVIQDATDAVRYRGGYMPARPGTRQARQRTFEERRLLTQLQNNQSVESLPAFGCDAGQDIFASDNGQGKSSP